METIIVLVTGIAGGLVGARLRIPGGSLIGAMAAVATLQLASTVSFEIAPFWSTLGQLLVGAVIGSSIDRQMLGEFRQVFVAGALAVGSMVAGGLIIGTGLALLGIVDPLTALFGLAPGGFAEMTAAAIALGANGPVVATIHLVRVLAVLVLLPILLRYVTKSAELRAMEARRRQAGGDLE